MGSLRVLRAAAALAVVALMAAGASAASAAVGGFAWGANEQGQLGNGSTAKSDVAVQVSNLTARVSGISAGSLHSLALLSNGGVEAWGDNDSGQLGDGTSTGPESCPSGF